MNISTLIYIGLIVFGSIILFWRTNLEIIKKKKVLPYLPFIAISIYFCTFASLFINFNDFSNAIFLLENLFTILMIIILAIIITRRTKNYGK